MKKTVLKIISIVSLFVMVLTLSACSSCENSKMTNFEKLVNNIYKSEEVIAGYNETDKIIDGDLETYIKNISFKVQRGESVKTQVKISEKTLSMSGDAVYDEDEESYNTINNVKYTTINGITYENEYQVPTYFLTFVLSEDFLEENYELTKDGKNYSLKAKVLDSKISSLFLNKSLGAISNLNIEILIENDKLQSFKATYKTKNGFDASINIAYLYQNVNSSNKDDKYASKGKVTFNLEGGSCLNTNGRMYYYYDFSNGELEMKIYDPNVLETDANKQVTKVGYSIEGWYQNKTELPDGTIEYTNKWDFAKDKITIDGVELYAKWVKNYQYSYELYYYDEANNEVLLDKYNVKKGEVFSAKVLKNKTVEGYTSLGYMDENGNDWNENFTHPGGDEDVAVKIYLKLIKGEYEVVKNATKFTSALSLKKNIYLFNDIDMKGKKICFDSYSGIILGNGHKIYNFKIDYDASRSNLKPSLEDYDDPTAVKDHLYISLFFSLKDTTISNLILDEIKIEVKVTADQVHKIIIAPLAIEAINLQLENVQIKGTIDYVKVLSDYEIVATLDNFYYTSKDVVKDDKSTTSITDKTETN